MEKYRSDLFDFVDTNQPYAEHFSGIRTKSEAMEISDWEWDGMCGECSATIKDGEDCCNVANEGKFLCLSCARSLAKKAFTEAEKIASEQAKLTKSLPSCDEVVDRKSYVAHLLHECTNYKELIKKLDTDSPFDDLKNEVISHHIHGLLRDELQRLSDADSDAA